MNTLTNAIGVAGIAASIYHLPRNWCSYPALGTTAVAAVAMSSIAWNRVCYDDTLPDYTKALTTHITNMVTIWGTMAAAHYLGTKPTFAIVACAFVVGKKAFPSIMPAEYGYSTPIGFRRHHAKRVVGSQFQAPESSIEALRELVEQFIHYDPKKQRDVSPLKRCISNVSEAFQETEVAEGVSKACDTLHKNVDEGKELDFTAVEYLRSLFLNYQKPHEGPIEESPDVTSIPRSPWGGFLRSPIGTPIRLLLNFANTKPGSGLRKRLF